MSPRTRQSAAALSVAAAALLSACGGDGATGPSSTLNNQEAQAVAGELFVEMFNAFSDISFDGVPTPGRAAASHARAGTAALRTPTEEVSFSGNCARGGRIVGTYRWTDDLNDAGTGTIAGTMTWNPQNCVVSTGKRDLTVNGDPSLQYAYSMSFVQFEPSANYTWRGTGGFRWDGGRCDINYTATYTPQGHYTVTGTVCGQNVSASY